MEQTTERRREKRLRYNWPVWFAENFADMLTQGQMVDVSSKGAAFTCYPDRCPYPDEQITTRFSVPRYGADNSFDMESFIRSGRICRVEEAGPFLKRVAVQFSKPLSFNPAENDRDEKDVCRENEELAFADKSSNDCN